MYNATHFIYGPFTSFLRHLNDFSPRACYVLRYQTSMPPWPLVSRVSNGGGAGLARLQRDPATGPSVPDGPGWKKEGDRYESQCEVLATQPSVGRGRYDASHVNAGVCG